MRATFAAVAIAVVAIAIALVSLVRPEGLFGPQATGTPGVAQAEPTGTPSVGLGSPTAAALTPAIATATPATALAEIPTLTPGPSPTLTPTRGTSSGTTERRAATPTKTPTPTRTPTPTSTPKPVMPQSIRNYLNAMEDRLDRADRAANQLKADLSAYSTHHTLLASADWRNHVKGHSDSLASIGREMRSVESVPAVLRTLDDRMDSLGSDLDDISKEVGSWLNTRGETWLQRAREDLTGVPGHIGQARSIIRTIRSHYR